MNIAIFTSKPNKIVEDIVKTKAKIRSKIKLLISDRDNTGIMPWAIGLDLHPIILRPKCFWNGTIYEATLLTVLKQQEIDAIILAGYRRKVPAEVIQAFPQKIIKSIPVPNPEDFHGQELYGRKLLRAVFRRGQDKAGVVIKFVEKGFSIGMIIKKFEFDMTGFQKKHAELDIDQAATDLGNMLMIYEAKLLIDAIQALETDRIKIENGQAVIEPLPTRQILPLPMR